MLKSLTILSMVAFLYGTLPLSGIAKAPASVSFFPEIDPKEFKKIQREMRKKWRPKCKKIWSKRNSLGDIYRDERFSKLTLLEIANLFVSGRYGCRKSPELALELFEYVVSPNPIDLATHDTLYTMIELHEVLKRPGAEENIVELRRIHWIKSPYDYGEYLLKWDPAIKRTFIARDDIWNYITSNKQRSSRAGRLEMEAYFDKLSPHYDLGKWIDLAESKNSVSLRTKSAKLLIEGTDVPKDTARAEKILWEAGKYSNEAQEILLKLVAPSLDKTDTNEASDTAKSLFNIAMNRSFKTEAAIAIRERLVPYYAKRMQNADPEISRDAINKLTAMAAVNTDSAMKPLRPWIDQKLKGNDLDQKRLAWRRLAELVRAGNPYAKDLLDADIKRTGGVIEVSYLDGIHNSKRSFITANDYPTRALREAREGFVSAEILLSPGGKAIEVFAIEGSDPSLTRAVSRSAMRRLRLRVLPAHEGRYIRVKIPKVQFRIIPCSNEDRPTTPEEPGAIIVNAKCIEPYYQI